MVSRVIDAPVSMVWQTFVDRWREGSPATAELRMTVLDPGRRCRIGFAGRGNVPVRIYAFTPVEVGPHRGGTVVTVVDDRSAALAGRLFDLVAGGFVARTAEGAVRRELEGLAAACTTRVITTTAA